MCKDCVETAWQCVKELMEMQAQKAEVQKVKPRPLPCYKSWGEDHRLSQEAAVKCRAQQTTVATPFK